MIQKRIILTGITQNREIHFRVYPAVKTYLVGVNLAL